MSQPLKQPAPAKSRRSWRSRWATRLSALSWTRSLPRTTRRRLQAQQKLVLLEARYHQQRLLVQELEKLEHPQQVVTVRANPGLQPILPEQVMVLPEPQPGVALQPGTQVQMEMRPPVTVQPQRQPEPPDPMPDLEQPWEPTEADRLLGLRQQKT